VKGWFNSVSFAGLGDNPIRPEPYSDSTSLALTTVRKVSFSTQFLSPELKQALSWAGCPAIAPLPYYKNCPPFSFVENDFDLVSANFLFLSGQLPGLHFSENSQAHAEPVSKITFIS